jgi:hypothetical protein
MPIRLVNAKERTGPKDMKPLSQGETVKPSEIPNRNFEAGFKPTTKSKRILWLLREVCCGLSTI